MRDFIGKRDLELYRFMEYQLGWIDDAGSPDAGYGTVPRRHGMMCLHAAAAIGAPYELAVRYAVSLELVQAFATIHGDVQDGNSERLGRPTVWWKWGPSQAINTGDGMHALARLSIFGLVESGEPIDRVSKALQLVDDSVLRMCEGEFMDVQLQEKLPVSADEYFEMAYLRVGSTFAAAAALPTALLPDEALPELESNLATFGREIGVARQVEQERAAMFDTEQRDPIEQGRIIAKKKSLPVAMLFDAIEDATMRRRIGEIYMQRVIDPERIKTITDAANELGINDKVRGEVDSRFERAQAALGDVPIASDAKSRLLEYASELVWGNAQRGSNDVSTA